MSPFHYATATAVATTAAAISFLPATTRYWVTGAVLLLYSVITLIGVFEIRLNYFCKALLRGHPGKNRIALTFDDGPDSVATPAILNLLKEHDAKATFFCIAEKAISNPDIILRILKDGHTLGNHSHSHKWWTNFFTTNPMTEEILRAQLVFKEICGKAPRYYRSPMGLTNPHLQQALKTTGLILVGWDVRPFDQGRPPLETVARVTKASRDGSIILLHDGDSSAQNIYTVVKALLIDFRKSGYSFVNLDGLE